MGSNVVFGGLDQDFMLIFFFSGALLGFGC